MCNFNPEKCTSLCPQYSMCAVKYSEFKYNTIESKINSLFNSVNQLNESLILLYKKINTLDNVNKEVQNTTVLTSTANTDSDLNKTGENHAF